MKEELDHANSFFSYVHQCTATVNCIMQLTILYQHRMLLNGLFNPLRLNADIALRGGGTAVLQESLNQDDVIAIGLVNLGSIPLAEAMGTDALIAQVVADDPQLLLDHSLRDGEHNLCASNPVTQAIIFDVLVEYQGDGEDPLLAGLLLRDLQPISVTVPHNITQPEF